MERALVVVDPVDGIDELVREAGELASGVGGSLVLLHVTSEAEYEEDRKSMEEVAGLEASYDVGQAEAGARQFADDVGLGALDGVDVEYEAIGAVGDRAELVLRTADEEGCDHVFLTGRRRSPAGKAIFGDVAQQIILNFAGPVTITTRSR